jgi:hypothetical protein
MLEERFVLYNLLIAFKVSRSWEDQTQGEIVWRVGWFVVVVLTPATGTGARAIRFLARDWSA